MLRSLQLTIALLSLCAVALLMLIILLLLPQSTEPPSVINVSPQETAADPSKMSAAERVKYEKAQEGEKLFKNAGCYSCHEVCTKKVGPALTGITKRREKAWIYKAVTNMPLMIQNKDRTAVELKEIYQTEMPAHAFLQQEEIDKIIYYIEFTACTVKK